MIIEIMTNRIVCFINLQTHQYHRGINTFEQYLVGGELRVKNWIKCLRRGAVLAQGVLDCGKISTQTASYCLSQVGRVISVLTHSRSSHPICIHNNNKHKLGEKREKTFPAVFAGFGFPLK